MTEAPKVDEPEKEDKTEEKPEEAAKEEEKEEEVPATTPTLARKDTPSPNAALPDETGGQTIEEEEKPEVVVNVEVSKDEPAKDDDKENEKKEPEAVKEESKEPEAEKVESKEPEAEKEESKEQEAPSTTETDTSKDSEKSLEEPEKEETKDAEAEAASDLETAMGTTIATDAETEYVEPVSKYMLLDRLFKFIRTDDKPLNPVLAGYFSKLTILMINRKQKQIIPYIFGPDSDILDCLLKHI